MFRSAFLAIAAFASTSALLLYVGAATAVA
jgi:hypothetical protein